jgi:hypothetical protein
MYVGESNMTHKNVDKASIAILDFFGVIRKGKIVRRCHWLCVKKEECLVGQ